ncbi:Transposase-like Mu [Rippkaea orientalis PCC 8801]|uniref:Transposase-like Mu n=1 Tax=Rippkaea orientalis (strain PCC 8801 / RF-1) TaxID=41431 RepID=B7JWC5_RIPO1|nr:Mu transposase C-terminal domain-containing protein [Rippkaea orientalis]ACK66970.1 Transposase-like Mu [Rippkaea orientalis PCC 8801]
MSLSLSIPDDSPHSHRLPSDEMITDEVKAKIDIIQSLIEPCDRITYRQRKEQAAKQLGVTIRSVERLLKKYREQGLIALMKTRSDKGKTRIDDEWKEFILNTYKEGNKGSKRITRHQVFLKVKGRAKQLGLNKEEFPSHQTVYRILDKFIEENERKKKARSPGYSGSRLTHITRHGRELEVEGSNDVWQCDHTCLDIRLVDEFGVLSRPWLTIIIDSYSRCVMGFFLGFYAPSSHIDALALRHAILPKSYSSDYQLKNEWNTYGIPTYYYTDGGKDFRSIHVTEQVAVSLGFNCFLRSRPSDGGIVERFFKTLNNSVLCELPGYTGSNVQQRPKNVDKDACLSLKDLEKILVKYIVDEYNQKPDARMKNQSRITRWEAGLLTEPYLYDERELDIALMKEAKRTLQKSGTLQFENLTYRSPLLKGREGERVAIRYDPDDVTTILVYEYLDDGTEAFLDYAHAQNLETEKLSYRELKAINKQLNQEEEAINNDKILDAMMERMEMTEELVKKNRQQRQQNAHEAVNSRPSVTEKLSISQPDEEDWEDDSEDEPLPTYKVQYMDDLFEDD